MIDKNHKFNKITAPSFGGGLVQLRNIIIPKFKPKIPDFPKSNGIYPTLNDNKRMLNESKCLLTESGGQGALCLHQNLFLLDTRYLMLDT